MLYGNFKNTTFTQSTYNCNAGVGFFIALIMRNFYPSALNADWYWYLLGMVVFSIPGLIASYKQYKSGYSLEQVKLTSRPFRKFYWNKKPHECGAWLRLKWEVFSHSSSSDCVSLGFVFSFCILKYMKPAIRTTVITIASVGIFILSP